METKTISATSPDSLIIVAGDILERQTSQQYQSASFRLFYILRLSDIRINSIIEYLTEHGILNFDSIGAKYTFNSSLWEKLKFKLATQLPFGINWDRNEMQRTKDLFYNSLPFPLYNLNDDFIRQSPYSNGLFSARQFAITSTGQVEHATKQDLPFNLDYQEITNDERAWLQEASGLPFTEYELNRIDNMSGSMFEQWCSAFLLKIGFSNIENIGGSGDQGADIIAVFNGRLYVIQCKCYSSPLGNKPIQEVFAAKTYYGADKALVITNNHFTKGAYDLAEKTNVSLIDRTSLQRLLQDIAGKEDKTQNK